MEILDILTGELSLKKTQIEVAVKLLDEGNTVPFIARYRKEVTGGMDDDQLRTLTERLTYLRNLQKRREEVLNLIGEQGKLTEEIEAAVAAALVLSIVTLLTLQGLTLAAQRDTEALRQEAICLEQENQRLQGYLAQQGTVEEILRIAQERLNMAMPDSIVIQPE